MKFDPYETWLGIPADRRPPTHYDLLGLTPQQSDPATIDQAALRRMSEIRQYQLGPQSDLAQEVLGELARARLVLMDPDRRSNYDAKLKSREEAGRSPSTAFQETQSGDALTRRPGRNDDPSSVFASLAVTEPADEEAGTSRPALNNGFVWLRRGLILASVVASHAAIVWAFFHFGFDQSNSNHQAPHSVQKAQGPPIARSIPKRQPASRPDLKSKAEPPPDQIVSQVPAGVPDGARIAQSEEPDPSATDGILEQKPPVEANPKVELSRSLDEPDRTMKKLGRAVGDTPEERLKNAGLKHVKTCFVVDDEDRLRKKLEEARLSFNQYADSLQRSINIKLAGEHVLKLDRQCIDLNLHIRSLDLTQARTNPRPNNVEKGDIDWLKNEREKCLHERNQAEAEAQRMRSGFPNPRAIQELDDEVRFRRQACGSMVGELHELIRFTRARYVEVAKNQEVKDAIKVLERRSKHPLKLGPSSEFENMARQTNRLEKSLQ